MMFEMLVLMMERASADARDAFGLGFLQERAAADAYDVRCFGLHAGMFHAGTCQLMLVMLAVLGLMMERAGS